MAVTSEAINEEAGRVLDFVDSIIPVFRAAEQTQALLRRKMGTGFRISKYTVRDEEVSLNRILADLLDPLGDHGQGGAFLNLFVEEVLKIPCDSPKEWSVDPNHYIRVVSPLSKSERVREKGYVDIALFQPDNVAVYIESKPWAEEGPEQLSDYAKDLLNLPEPRKVLVVLAPDLDWRPSSLSKALEEKLGDRFKTIPFGRRADQPSIVGWLESCARISEAENVRVFVSDLREFLAVRFGDEKRWVMAEDPFLQVLKDSVRENKDRLKIVARLEGLASELREEISNRFLRDLAQACNRKMGPEWAAKCRVRGHGRTRLALKKAQWPDEWEVALEAETPRFEHLWIGFACPTSDPGKFQVASEAEQQQLRGALENVLRRVGASVGGVSWVPAYVYLPDRLSNWNTGESLVLLSGLEALPSGRKASVTIEDWLVELASAAEPVVDKILAEHGDTRPRS